MCPGLVVSLLDFGFVRALILMEDDGRNCDTRNKTTSPNNIYNANPDPTDDRIFARPPVADENNDDPA